MSRCPELEVVEFDQALLTFTVRAANIRTDVLDNHDKEALEFEIQELHEQFAKLVGLLLQMVEEEVE